MTRTAAEVGASVLERFARMNDERKARGNVIEAAIRQVLAEHTARPLSAKQVARLIRWGDLGTEPLSIRGVQWHLTRIGRRDLERAEVTDDQDY